MSAIVTDFYSVMTKAGRIAAIASGNMGPKIEITGFRIGSRSAAEGAIADKLATDVDDFVYESDTTRIAYALMPDSESCLFRITLDENIGDFDVGQIALMIGPTMFSKSVLFKKTPKWKSVLPGRYGNTVSFDIVLTLSDVEGCINLTLLKSLYTSLPEVANETLLPVPSSSLYNVYLVRNHTTLGIPTLAVRRNNEWYHSPHRIVPNQGDGVIVIQPSMFDASVKINMAVYYDYAAKKFYPADPAVAAKSPIGIRTADHEITTLGFVKRYTPDDIWPGTMTVGQMYSTNVAPNAGKPTAIATYGAYGLAVSNDLVYVSFPPLFTSFLQTVVTPPIGEVPVDNSHTHTLATAVKHGFMSMSDFSKLAAPETFVIGDNGIKTEALATGRVTVSIDDTTIDTVLEPVIETKVAAMIIINAMGTITN